MVVNHVFLEIPSMYVRTHIQADFSGTTFVRTIKSNFSLPQGWGVAHVNSYVQTAYPNEGA